MTEAQTATTIAEAVAKALGMAKLNKKNPARKSRKSKKAAKLTEAEKAIYMAQNDAKCVEAFTKAGYSDIQPRVNVLTYDKWVAQGRLVRKGEKSVKVGPFSLFHVSQTDALPVTAESPAANQVAA